MNLPPIGSGFWSCLAEPGPGQRHRWGGGCWLFNNLTFLSLRSRPFCVVANMRVSRVKGEVFGPYPIVICLTGIPGNPTLKVRGIPSVQTFLMPICFPRLTNWLCFPPFPAIKWQVGCGVTVNTTNKASLKLNPPLPHTPSHFSLIPSPCFPHPSRCTFFLSELFFRLMPTAGSRGSLTYSCPSSTLKPGFPLPKHPESNT